MSTRNWTTPKPANRKLNPCFYNCNKCIPGLWPRKARVARDLDAKSALRSQASFCIRLCMNHLVWQSSYSCYSFSYHPVSHHNCNCTTLVHFVAMFVHFLMMPTAHMPAIAAQEHFLSTRRAWKTGLPAVKRTYVHSGPSLSKVPFAVPSAQDLKSHP